MRNEGLRRVCGDNDTANDLFHHAAAVRNLCENKFTRICERRSRT
jgi:hypothetical protein